MHPHYVFNLAKIKLLKIFCQRRNLFEDLAQKIQSQDSFGKFGKLLSNLVTNFRQD